MCGKLGETKVTEIRHGRNYIRQGDLVRVSGKDRDTLQAVIALLRNSDFGIDMQFTNYRTV